nr:asparagine synthase-related protein [Candidatus Sigynarchaeota archaeon]
FHRADGEKSIDAGSIVAIDGQIDNIDELRRLIHHPSSKILNTGDIILSMYREYGIEACQMFKGQYALLIKDGSQIFAARDPVGFDPLYIIEDAEKIVIASELKALVTFHADCWILEPGSAYFFNGTSSSGFRFFDGITLFSRYPLPINDIARLEKRLFDLVNTAVKKAIPREGHVAALLSGGVDSAIICALALNYVSVLNVYTVAYDGAEDLRFARLFSRQYPGRVNHHVIEMHQDDMVRIIRDVIYALETFDAALIRSAIPMYHLCSAILPGTDILLTGEGADELFGGYSYLKDLSQQQLNAELLALLKTEHATGLQRVDRIPYHFGIEARAPLFDFDLVKFAFGLPNSLKIRENQGQVIEKWIEREAFKHILPVEIATRKKAKFSQGAGSEFVMRDLVTSKISDDEYAREREIFPGIFIKSKEELYYWRIFRDLFNPTDSFIRNLPRTANFAV